EVCFGTVVATKRLLYPEAVGGDIGCGMAAVRFSCAAQLLDDERVAARILAGLYEAVPTMRHPMAASPPLPVELERTRLSHERLETIKNRDGRAELGTLGRGNHFLELQSDDEGALWLMLHSGSRALGQAIRDHHLHHAVPGRTGLRHMDAQSPSGQAY